MIQFFSYALVLSFFMGCSGPILNPNHYGKFTFKGVVLDGQGKPLSDTWVKIKNWETLTNQKGEWTQEHVIHCGSLREDMDGMYENDVVLFSKLGYLSQEEAFHIKHPKWFEGCQAEQTLIFNTTLLTDQETPKTFQKKNRSAPSQEKPADLPYSGVAL
jgi:hypothetical protein